MSPSVAAACALMAAATLAVDPRAATAQESGLSSVLVTIVDENGDRIGGVEVSATEVTRGARVAATTGREGMAALRELAPGVYDLIAIHGTLRAATTVRLRAGVDAVLELVLKPATYVETVTVDAAQTLLDTRSPGQSMTLDAADGLAIPVSGNRSWFNLLPMVPGTVVVSFPSARSPFFFYHHGSGSAQHVTVVDGAELSSASQSLPVNVQVPTALVNQMDARVSGVDASSPLGWGLNVAIETRTGTNRISGSVLSSFQDASWFDSNIAGGASLASDQSLTDVTLGGPILRNRAWFMSSYRLGRTRGESGLTALEFSTLEALLGKAPARPRQVDNDVLFGKGTFGWRGSSQLSASYQFESTADRVTNADFGVTNEIGGHVWNARYTQVLPGAILLRGSLAFHNRSLEDFPDRPDLPRRSIFGSVLDSAGRLTGVTALGAFGSTRPEGTDSPEHKLTGSVDLTTMITAAGTHEVKSGLFVDRHQRTQVRTYNAGGRALEELVLVDAARPALGAIPFHLRVYDRERATLVDESGRDLAFYLQDRWRASSRLTVSGGVRVDIIRRQDRLAETTTQRSTELGPNVGAAYAVDPTLVVRGHYGRRFSTLSETAARFGTSAAGFTDHYDRDRDGRYETELLTPATSGTRRDVIIDLDDWRQPYVDEISAAVEKQIAGRWSVGAIFLRRYYEAAAALIETNAVYDGVRFVGYRDESLNQIYQLTNNRSNRIVYDELSLSSRLTLPRIHGLATYTRQWRCVDGSWLPGDPAAVLQADAFRNCRGIGDTQRSTASGADHDSLSGRSMTEGVQWRDHIVNLAGSVEWPFEIQTSAQYRFQSGPWSGPIVTRADAIDPRVGPSTLRLSNGRLVSNPLGTLIRFAGSDRNDRQFQLPGVHELNLAVRKKQRFGRVDVQAGVEVYNATNEGRDLQHVSGGNQVFSTAFGLGTNRQTPRSALIRFDVSF